MVGDELNVRILHASAALGDATYVRHADGWQLKSGFDFKRRGARGANDGERQLFFAERGWLANPDNQGSAPREFSLALGEKITYIAVAYLAIDEPMAVSHWPPTVADDCIATRMVQGYLPAQARFNSTTWHRVR